MIAGARAEQIAHIAATRERQVAQAQAIEGFIAHHFTNRRDEYWRPNTHHGYALNVKNRRDSGKVRTAPWESEDPDEVAAYECEYGEASRDWWNDANDIAQEHGFEGVHAAGRSGGWCVPYPQPDVENMWPHAIEEWVRDIFAPFGLEIEDLLARAQAEFYDGEPGWRE